MLWWKSWDFFDLQFLFANLHNICFALPITLHHFIISGKSLKFIEFQLNVVAPDWLRKVKGPGIDVPRKLPLLLYLEEEYTEFAAIKGM